ncbi:diadenosine 5',5'''-P1,P4-tetraphosphate phosphorylase 2 [Colletotrichum spaethianum]|uniref:Diadenosine 5',5'''-P1,P4-tetraphosphate phosphorylase 2 n=1 Tax=Colletotrichum spaethianum TaxID=700344 RepID=A0AA37LEM2_9PEZI|nr:diadenosine 5',5'''-P1,P4-tetraphosphate phosphorylase 2 [Colletotrichum spaethianum]GKT45999.1 diadenosine 5',5'''-P1,P4-tetraphosphate phosphorylase 2 [Colletotrichum spaethianum]
MGSTAIDEALVLARFDKLVGDGVVMYAEDMEKIYYEDGGFKSRQVEFRITSALKSKPGAVKDNAALDDANANANGDSHASRTKNPNTDTNGNAQNGTPRGIEFDANGCLPGGDISIAGYEIGPVGESHVLAFNKFCAYRPHLLLMTADGRKRQFEGLSSGDLGVASEVLAGLNRGGRGGGQEYLVIFNCGKEGGCSRLHKHMQVIPAPDVIPLWPDEVGSTGDAEGQELPMRYFIHRFSESSNGNHSGGRGEMPSADELADAYWQMLQQAAEVIPGRKEAVEKDNVGREVTVPHNVVLSERWMVVIPRVTDGVDGAGVNAAGMLGVVWASETKTVDKWKRLGPRLVLSEVGIRAWKGDNVAAERCHKRLA